MRSIPPTPAVENKNTAQTPVLFSVRGIPIGAFGASRSRWLRKLVLLTLASYADPDGSHCHPGKLRLSSECGPRERSIHNALVWLRDHGFVEIGYKKGPKGTNLYVILIPETMHVLVHSALIDTPCTSEHVPCTAGYVDPARIGASDLPVPTNRRPTKARAQKNSAPPFVLPDWVPVQPWDGFVEMRIKIRKPLTDHAKELAVRRLAELRDGGEAPEEVLNRSILGSYQGLISLKGDRGPRKPPATQQKFSELNYPKAGRVQ